MNYEVTVSYKPTGHQRSIVVGTMDDASEVLQSALAAIPQHLEGKVSGRIEPTNDTISKLF